MIPSWTSKLPASLRTWTRPSSPDFSPSWRARGLLTGQTWEELGIGKTTWSVSCEREIREIRVVGVNKRWSGCKRATLLGKINLCRGTRSSVRHLWKRGQRRYYRLGSVAAGPFCDSLRYPLLLIFPPDRVEVPGNARHVHREAQDFKKQVHRLHSNRRSERCPQADSAAVIILPHGLRRGYSTPCVGVAAIPILLGRAALPFRPFRRTVLGHMGMDSLGACPHT